MLPVNEIVNARSEPGIVIFNLKKQITFANQIAWEIFNTGSNGKHYSHLHRKFKIPGEVSRIYTELKSRLHQFASNSCPDAVYLKKTVQIQDGYFLTRAFIISDPMTRASTHFLLLFDKLSNRSKSNMHAARAHYHLSLREFGVAQLLATGFTNKEIANQLNLAESTVKEYIRNIMQKVKASTRTGIVARVLTLSDENLRNREPEAEIPDRLVSSHA